MVKIISRVVFLILVAFSLLTFIYPVDALALWAKRFDNNGWDDFGSIWPSPSGGYYLWGLTANLNEPSSTSKDYLLLSKLDASGNVQWTKEIYTGDYDDLFIVQLGGNDFFIQGTTRLIKGGNSDALWAKFSVNPSTGSFTPVFQKVFRGSGDDSLGFGITESGDIGIGTGATNSFSGDSNDYDMLIVKINSTTGNVEWSKVFDHGLKDGDPAVIPISGGYMLGSSVKNTTSGGEDILVAKLNSTGVPQWAKLYGGIGINGATIHEISGGNYLLLGITKTSLMSTDADIILIKINESGGITWGKKYSSSGMDTPGLIYENPDGTFILTGSISEIDLNTFSFTTKILVMKLTSGGDILWKKTFGGGASDFGSFIRMDDGSYLLTGSSSSFSSEPDDQDVLFGKFDSDFTPQWVRTFGGTGADTGGIFSISNQYMLTGETDSFSGTDGGADIFGITLNPDGTFPNCQYFKDVTLTEGDPTITATNLSWTPAITSLTSRTHTISLDTITLSIDPITLTETEICTAAQSGGILSVTTSGDLTSSGVQGGPFTPSSKDFTLQNTGESSIDWTASKTQAWVTLSSASGTLAAGATTTVTVSINSGANSLTAGPYTDTVTFTNTTNGNGNTTRSVNLTVNAPAPGVLSISPAGGLTSSGTQGGPFTPPVSITYTLQNTGGTSIDWTASKIQAWVTLSSATGTLAAGATTTVTVSINSGALSLAAGPYTDTVTFTNTTNGNGNTTRSVTLTVQGGLSVTPSENLISTGFEGGPFIPLIKEYTLTNTGTASMSWSANKTQTWVKLSKTSGTLAPGASIIVTATILKSANVLDGGTFNDTITFTNNTNGIGNTTRSVNLTVNPILVALSSPADEEYYTVSSYYSPAGPPTFNWTTSGGTLKKLELWFSTQSDFSSGLVKVKGSTASSGLLISSSSWKKILLLPGLNGGTVYWKAVGTKGNNKIADSDVRFFSVEGPDAVDNPMLSHTSKTDPNPPVLSWNNKGNIKFKVVFYNDPDFYNNPTKSGVKKTILSFSITNPNDNGGVFDKELTSSQWTTIINLGSTIYWHIESSDVIKRSNKKGPQNFDITP